MLIRYLVGGPSVFFVIPVVMIYYFTCHAADRIFRAWQSSSSQLALNFRAAHIIDLSCVNQTAADACPLKLRDPVELRVEPERLETSNSNTNPITPKKIVLEDIP